MIFDIPTLIAHVSSVMTLLPGDVILTGTPEGVGPMQVGDEVEVSIDGLGALTNKVAAAVTQRTCPRPDGAQPDRQPARRPGPHRALQLGVRAPPRRHLRVPDRGHRRLAQHPGVLRRAARPLPLARPRLGRGSRGRRRPRPLPPVRARRPLPRRARPPARVGAHLRLLLHQRRGRGAPQGVRLQGDGLRRPLPRPHRRAGGGVRGRGPDAGRPLPDARRRDHLGRPGPRRDHASRPSTCPTSRCAAPTATRSTRWSTRSTTR